MSQHLNAYDRALVEIKNRLLFLSELVENQLQSAVKSFIEQDEILAEKVIGSDDEIDLLDDKLEMDCLELISIQQPVVDELRFLASAMRISRELERISDYACNIAEAAIQLKKRYQWVKPLIDLPKMADLVQNMMKKSFLSFKDNNLNMAQQMDDDDQEVDQLYFLFYDELTEVIKSNPDRVDQAFSLLLVIRYLERIADHGVNIAEMVIFTETGERQPFKRKAEPGR